MRTRRALALTAAVALTSVPAAHAGPAAENESSLDSRRAKPGSALAPAVLDDMGAVRTGSPDADEPGGFVLLLRRDVPRSLQTARSWARQSGLHIEAEHRDAGVVVVAGTRGRVARALETEFAEVVVDGEQLIVPTETVTLPRDVARAVSSVAGLVDVQARPMSVSDPLGAADPSQARGATSSETCARYFGETLSERFTGNVPATRRSNRLCGWSAADLRAMHRVAPDAGGAGARIGIVGTYDDPAVAANSNALARAQGEPELAAGQYVVHPAAGEDDSVCGDRGGWSEEQHLDVQAVHAIAPAAQITYFASPTCLTRDLFTTVLEAAESGEVDTISLSLGSREEFVTGADRALLQRALVQANARGVSVFAAAGNDGDYSNEGDHVEIDVTSPASSPWVTAVGGLSVGMRRDGSMAALAGWASRAHFARNGGVIPPGFVNGGGGGTSNVYRRPAWQRGVVDRGVPGAGRALPDVATVADPRTGLLVRTQTADGPLDQIIGGTSLATPVVATLVSVAKATTGRRLGLATPWLYRLAGTAALRDVVPTSAAVYSPTPLNAGQTFPETVITWDRKPQTLQSAPGWDALTGLGMPSAPDLTASLAGTAPGAGRARTAR